MHFGASKPQITLHTGVLYHRLLEEHQVDLTDGPCSSTENQGPHVTSFCTISSSLRHDACAVWAHFTPVLKMLKDNFPAIDTLHFHSDGPTTQYRNKTNFFLMTYFCACLGLKEASWNFSEAGHEKGPADKVGGLLKRSADQAIVHGTDIISATTLLNTLKIVCRAVQLFEIYDSDIQQVDAIVPRNLKPVPNTMQLHQLVWSNSKMNTLGLRILSCSNCGVDHCSHFSPVPAYWIFPVAKV